MKKLVFSLIYMFLVISGLTAQTLPATDGFQFPSQQVPNGNNGWTVGCNPFWGTCVKKYHTGEDASGNAGDPVYAPANGIVKHTGVRTSYGNVIVIEHDVNGEIVCSLNGHLRTSGLAVEVDDVVERGDLLGYLGTYQQNGGWDPHYHFGINKGSYKGDWEPGCAPLSWWYSGYNGGDECAANKNDWYDPSDFVTAHPALVGYYSNGWHTDGTSQAILDRFNQANITGNPLGHPYDNRGTEFVHEFWGVYLQDFYGEDNGYNLENTAVIIDADDDDEAWLLKEGFWGWYMTNREYGTNNWKPQGPIEMGAPTSDEYEVDGQIGLIRQEFEHGYLDYTVATNVQPHYYGSGGGSVDAQGLVENYVTIKTDPIGAEIWDGQTSLTTTPMVWYMEENDSMTFTAKLDGYYDKSFTIYWSDGGQTVTVELEPTSTGSGGTNANFYNLSTTPGFLDFGLSSTEQTFTTEDGVSSGTVTWTITTSQPWITVSPVSGSGNDEITVSIDRTNLSGYYEETVSIASNAGTINLPVVLDAFTAWSGTQTFTMTDESALDDWLLVEGSPDSSGIENSELRLFNGSIYKTRNLSEAILVAPGSIFDSLSCTFDLDNGSQEPYQNQITTIYVNWQDANHFYRWFIANSASNNLVKFQKVYLDGQGIQQTSTLWQQNSVSLGPGEYTFTAINGTFTLKDEPSGSNINASVSDGTYEFGRIGFGVSEEEAFFDNIEIKGHTPVVYRNATFVEDQYTLGKWDMNGSLTSTAKRTNSVTSNLLTETSVTSAVGLNYESDKSYGLTRGQGCLVTDLDTELDNLTKFTVEGWFQFNNEYNNVILGRWDTNLSQLQLEWNSSNGPIYIFVASSTADVGNHYAYSANIAREEDRWYYIAVVYDGTQTGNNNRLKIYLDGEIVSLSYNGTIPSSLSNIGGSLPFILGYRKVTPGGSSMGGRIGPVRISNTARTESEITEVMNNEIGFGVTPASLSFTPATYLVDTILVSSNSMTTISKTADWLSLSTTNTQGMNQMVVVTTDSTDLVDSTYADTLTITDGETTEYIPVTLEISSLGSGPFAVDVHTIGLWNMTGSLQSDGKRINEATSALLNEVSVSSTTGLDEETDGAYGFSKASWSRLLTDLDTEIDGLQRITLEAWVKFDNSNNNVILGRWETNKSFISLEWQGDPGAIYALIASSTSDGGNNRGYSSNLNRGSGWHYLALVYDGTQTGNSNRLKVYLDGTEVSLSYAGTIPATLSTCGSGYPLILGYYKDDNAGTSSLGGTIAAVRVSDTSRTAQEISDNYSQGLSKPGAFNNTESITLLPEKFQLHQNYPNPFNPTTILKFDLPKDANVKLVIYNIIGQEVKVLLDRPMQAGFHQTSWDRIDDSGNPVASGVYLYRLKTDNFVETKKMILIK